MIKNLTSKKEIVPQKKYAKSLFSRIRGLMFTLPNKYLGLIMVFRSEEIVSLHMLFVFYPIDILWLDKNKRVVDLRKPAFPFMPWIEPKGKAKYVVELPADSIKKTGTKIGDLIGF